MKENLGIVGMKTSFVDTSSPADSMPHSHRRDGTICVSPDCRSGAGIHRTVYCIGRELSEQEQCGRTFCWNDDLNDGYGGFVCAASALGFVECQARPEGEISDCCNDSQEVEVNVMGKHELSWLRRQAEDAIQECREAHRNSKEQAPSAGIAISSAIMYQTAVLETLLEQMIEVLAVTKLGKE